jgi:hypothetical protein
MRCWSMVTTRRPGAAMLVAVAIMVKILKGMAGSCWVCPHGGACVWGDQTEKACYSVAFAVSGRCSASYEKSRLGRARRLWGESGGDGSLHSRIAKSNRKYVVSWQLS